MVIHSVDARAFMMKHRMATLAATVSLATVTTLGIATAQGMINIDNDEKNVTTQETRAEGKSVTTTTTTQTPNESGPQTNVIVNDQPIAVPDNGTTSRTITNDNGTTHVEVSNSNNGTSVSSSTITNNSSRSSNVSSQSFNVTTNNSP
jgi:hypothetical protein